MLGAVAVWHELWPEQQHDHHDHVAQRQHDDAAYGHHPVGLADDYDPDDAATPPSPASYDGQQHDDHASHAHDDHDAIEPFVVAQQRIDDDSAAALTFTRRPRAER
jgi:hypothetical protein